MISFVLIITSSFKELALLEAFLLPIIVTSTSLLTGGKKAFFEAFEFYGRGVSSVVDDVREGDL